MDLSPADLSHIRELYAQGLYRQAYDAAAAIGPIRTWTSTPARLIGGRLAIQLGAPALGRQLHLLAFRSTPAYPEAIYYHARYRMERFGPLATWEFMRKHPDWSDALPELHGDWLALSGFIAARLRDFDRAERWLNRAEAICPRRPWPCIERSSSYELADRLEDALSAARRSLEIHPWFRPGVQSTAHLLLRLGREREALDLLTEADSHLESGLIAAQLAALQNDLGRHADARKTLERYADLTPLMEPDTQKWLAARWADTAYFLGERAAAIEQARAASDDFYTAFAARLENDGPRASGSAPPGDAPGSCVQKRVLPLELPANPHLTIYDLLARFWKHPLPNPDHDSPAPVDGLPDAAERDRAERAGWAAREFSLSLEAAVELIRREVPFVVSLVEAGFTQSRLCIGADAVRGTVFLVDGMDRRPVEAPVANLIERFGAFGPRGLALVPVAESSRLKDLVLPDGPERDALYAIQKPLLTHDRAAAIAARDHLHDRYRDHKLAKFADLVVARYDAHPAKLLVCYDDLLAGDPHEATWVLSKAAVLRDLNRTAERVALLEAEGTGLASEPLVSQSFAQILLPNPHRQDEAAWLLRRSVRNRPMAAAGYYLLATQRWEERRFEDAAEVYRFACTLDEREDQFTEAYFRAARATDQVPEVLRLFQQKAGRAAIPAPAATRALFHALMDRDEPDQAHTALDQAIKKLEGVSGSDAAVSNARHSLGELLLFRAECQASAGKHPEAEADLLAARPLVPPVVWHKAAGRVARIKPDLAVAGAHYLEVVKLDPLFAEAHRMLTSLLTETDGRAAARTHLAQACQRFPHYYPLLKLRAEFLSGDPDADADRAILDMIEECGRDAWAYRQRALVLADRKRLDEALADVQTAGAIEPEHPWYYAVYAQVLKRSDRLDDALAMIREALRRNIDQEPLIAELVQLSRGRSEKRDALKFLEDELRHQPHTGEGLVAFVAQSLQVYAENADPEDYQEMLEVLEEILDERPDLWQAWSVVIQQMAGLGRLEEAHSLAREAVDRFPLLAKLWIDRAQVCQALGNAEGRLDSLRQAVAVAPGWSPAAHDLAVALDDAGEPDEAVIVMERAAARNPLDPYAHGFLAEQLWDASRSREALDCAKTAVRHQPGYDWAWHAVQLWSERLEVPDEPADLARELTRDRSGDPRVWLRLARLLSHPRHNDEVLAALDRAIALDPKNVEAHDLKAERLAEMGKFDSALAAAKPEEFGDDPPIVLQGRAAWVEARRGNYASAIPPMQALVAVDPTYLWGWHQLAEWYNETGRAQNYLEAASELVRLQPGHPVAMMMRGEAKLQTGDRDGGKSDLREALKVSPNYSHAAAVLFDACLADDEVREARQVLAVLQEHAAGPEVAVKQIQLCCRTEDAEGAMRAFAEVCEGEGQSPYPIQAALSELRLAELDERAQRVLRDSWQTGGPFHPWVPIFWVDSHEGQEAEPGERLRAAEACIKAYPKFMPGHDCKAEQLALSGRFDEAIAACKPADLDPLPIELRGRVAWIENRRGDRAKAIALMRQLVADNPTFVLGWRQLAAWYDAAGRHRECLEATEQFVKLEATNPLAYVYRGEARRSVADRRGALADFQKAFELDPASEAAGLNLVTEQLATGDLSGAARTLAAVSEHSDSPLVRLRAVQLACRQGDFDAAVARFRALAQDAEATRTILRDAVVAFEAEGWGPRLNGELKELAFAPDGTPEVAALWAEGTVAAGSPDDVAERLPDLLAKNPAAGREVVLAYLWALASANKPVQGAVTKYSEVLRSDTAAWARAGEALAATGNLAYAAAWLADWRDREGLEAWMLRPVALAYRVLDQDEKAAEVCRAAVKLGGPDVILADFRAWLALDLALANQTEEARAHISRVDSVGIPDGTRLVLAMAEAVVMVAAAGPGGKAAAFAEARDHVRSAASACGPRDVPPGAGRAYRKVVHTLTATVGTIRARLWAGWQRLRPWVK